MNLVSDVFINILKPGIFVRIINKNTQEKLVGIFICIDDGEIHIKHMNSNFIGDLFYKKNKMVEKYSLINYSVSPIDKKEFKNLLKIIPKTKYYSEIIEIIDKNIKNSDNNFREILKIGYKKFPMRKKELFENITRKYINEEIPLDFSEEKIILNSKEKNTASKKMYNKLT